MSKAVVAILMLTALFDTGCASYYRVIRIPDTPDALAAYRQCAAMPHYYFAQEKECLAGIPGITSAAWSETGRPSNPQWGIGEGCREIILITEGGNPEFYYYWIQACHEPTPPPLQSGKDDSQGVRHIDHAQP